MVVVEGKQIVFTTAMLAIISYCVAVDSKQDKKKKELVIENIVSKVANLTGIISDLPIEKRVHALHLVKNDLADALGIDHGHYINVIMKELVTKTGVKEILASHNNTNEAESTGRRNLDDVMKSILVQKIADKIVSVAKKHIGTVKSDDEKENLFDKISRKVLNAAVEVNHGQLKSYKDLISLALKVSKHKLFLNNTTEMDKVVRTIINLEQVNKFGPIISRTLEAVDTHCYKVVDKICDHIKFHTILSCIDENLIRGDDSVNNRTNYNNNDIFKGNCSSSVVLKNMQNIKDVLGEIQDALNHKCLLEPKQDSDKEELKTQTIILQAILDNYYTNLTAVKLTELNNTDQTANTTRLEATIFIKLFSKKIIESFCSRNRLKGEVVVRSVKQDSINKVTVEKNPKVSPRDCKCKEEFCDHDCNDLCNRSCWQKYSLSHWNCSAAEGKTTVSLDVICDGKLDCYDGTDETKCARGENHFKFEAIATFKSVLEIVNRKSLSLEYKNSRHKLTTLASYINKLQKMAVMSNLDSDKIINLRDDTFSTIESIYSDLMMTSSFDRLNKDFVSLHEIKESLINALKLSHIGNTAPSVDCLCRDSDCILIKCTMECKRSCVANPVLTSYFCKNQNVSFPTEVICDGKNDCSDGDDEKNCKKEVCRSHHLMMLRKSLETISSKHKDTAIEEAVYSWKTKVITGLDKDEAHERPNLKIIKDLIKRILNDLVETYGKLQHLKSISSEFALKEFKEISKTVQQAIRTCGI